MVLVNTFVALLQELLPNVRIANESRELVLNCCSEFIHYIATQANEICNQHHKKTINAEHILTGMNLSPFVSLSWEVVPCSGKIATVFLRYRNSYRYGDVRDAIKMKYNNTMVYIVAVCLTQWKWEMRTIDLRMIGGVNIIEVHLRMVCWWFLLWCVLLVSDCGNQKTKQSILRSASSSHALNGARLDGLR